MISPHLEQLRQLLQAGQWSLAENLFHQLRRTGYQIPPDLWNEYGIALARNGRMHDAEIAFRQLLQHYPDYGPAYSNLGLVLRRLGRMQDAAEAFKQALSIDPQAVEALNNLALTLRDLGRPQEAIQYLVRALQSRPDQITLHVNLAQLYRSLNQHLRAVEHFRSALAARPEQVEICLGLSLSLLATGEEREAEAWARHAVHLAPSHADAWNTLGTILSSCGRYDEAFACFQQALTYQPQHYLAHLNRGMIYLLRGNWQQGWEDYEYRLLIQPHRWQDYRAPRWQADPLAGRTILLVAEQGIGDTIQFVRYAQVLENQGARVLLECPRNLVPLLSRASGLAVCYASGDQVPGYDYYSPLLSLPRYLNTRPDNVPATVPYITADPNLVAYWKDAVTKYEGVRIGIAWQGSPSYANDRQRSVPLRKFACLASIDGVRLISLQKGPGEEQLREVDFPVVDLGAGRDESNGAFMDTAAIVQHLDLVICTDSAIAHLVGALGRPVWLLLGQVCDWRWGTEGSTTPWYPTMRLFRQEVRQDWDGVFRQVRKALQEFVANRRQERPLGLTLDLRVPVSPGELLDKITILRIKQARIRDEEKLRHVEIELAELEQIAACSLPQLAELDFLVRELQSVNETLWDVEDALRECERRQKFDAEFVALARSVYRYNDRRAEIKKRINLLLGSRLVEEKSYRPY